MKKIKNKLGKKYYKAFTLVELIVVVAIMLIVGTTSFLKFGDFLDKTTSNNIISNFTEELKNLDNKIKKQDLFDYKIVLKTNRNGFYYYENYYFGDKKQKLQAIDFENGTGSFYIPSGTSTGVFVYSIYLDDKLSEKKVLQADKTVEIKKFLQNDKVFIKSYLDGNRLNNIKIKYFSSVQENSGRNNVLLKKITCDSGNTTKLIIKNIGGKKEFFGDSGDCLNPKLVFEVGDNEIEVKLK